MTMNRIALYLCSFFFCFTAMAKEIKLDTIAPSEERQSITWNVNREIIGFKVKVVEGRPIINKAKIVKVEEWTVGAYFDKGQSYEQRWDTPRQAGQITVNLDNARETKLQLFIYTK